MAAPNNPGNLFWLVARAVLTRANSRYNKDDIFLLFLDQFTDEELLNIMEADISSVPIIFMRYGLWKRWKFGVNMLDNEDSMKAWHYYRHRRLLRDREIENGKRLEADTDQKTQLGEYQRLKKQRLAREVEKYREESTWLYHLRQSILQLQGWQARVNANVQPTPSEQEALNYVASIRWDFTKLIRENDTGRIEPTQREIRQLGPPPPAPPTPILPPPIPIPRDTADEHCQSVPFLVYEEIIMMDAVETLKRLTRLGYFNPQGYTHEGCNFLVFAILHSAEQCVDWLLTCYSPAQIVGPAAMRSVVRPVHNHAILGELIFSRDRQRFHRVWTSVTTVNPALNATGALDEFHLRELCEWVDLDLATSFANHGLNIAHLPIDLTVNPETDGGTNWHFAVFHRNIDMMDFLIQHIPGSILHTNRRNESPFRVAFQRDNFDAGERLALLGAPTFHDAGQHLLRDLETHTDNRWTELCIDAPAANLATEPWIYYTVKGLDRSIRDGRITKARGTTKAKRLILTLREGRNGQRARTNARGLDGLTPYRFAMQNGLAHIAYLLLRRGTQNGRADDSRFSLRTRPRVAYTA